MSAFLVNKTHIQFIADVLAEAASNRNHIFSHSVLWFMDQLGYELYNKSIRECEDAAIAVSNQLYELNEVALHGRYGGSITGTHPIEKIKYTSITASPVQQFKAFQCLRYQCSEDEADGTSLYRKLDQLIGGMASSIVHTMPAYDTAQWEIQDTKTIATRVI